jgi:hypothetical protein
MCSTPSAVVEEVLNGVGGVDEEILALVDLAGLVEAALVERVGRFDAAEGYKAEGAYSFACWLAARADVGRSEAGSLARFARQLARMRDTATAVAEGKLSVAKARLLAGVVNDRTREVFDEHESFLIDNLQGLDVEACKLVLGEWKRMADPDGPDPGDPGRNWARMTNGWGDRWHLEADLDPVTGALVNSVLQALVDRMHKDGRFTDRDLSGGQQLAEALPEMAMRASGPHPDQPSVSPDIVVVVPVEHLLNDQPDAFQPGPELLGTGPLAVSDVYRLAMLGTISTMVIDGQGRPLHLGRKQRLASADQWIALRVRDVGCVIPGCDRPADWCSAHHLDWWERDGGSTDLANLCLVCTAHHHLIHDLGWTLHHDTHGTWQLTRPDGTTPQPPRYPNHHRRPRARARPPV